MKASGTEPDTLPSSPDLSLATFTGCLTPQAQFPTQAELAFVCIWLAHMMLPMKRVSKMLWLLFPEGVIKEFSWRPTFCPAGELLPAQDSQLEGNPLMQRIFKYLLYTHSVQRLFILIRVL